MTPFEQPEGLQPLRGPLGWRELFFTRGSSPILAFVRPRRVWIFALIIIAFLTWLACQLRGDPDTRDGLLIIQILAWLGLEGACFIYGLWLGWLASPAQRRRRIAELALTNLRPIEVGQWILARGIWSAIWLFGGVVAAICVIQLAAFHEYSYFLLGYLAIAVNTVLTLYMTQWMQLTLFLSAKSWIQAFRRQLMFLFVYNIVIAFLVGVYIVVLIAIDEMFVSSSRGQYLLTNVAIYPVLIPFWLIKYRFARAFAERLERAVFHRIEF